LAAKQATSTIPVVMAAGADPVATGLVAGLHRPGGNLTGSMQFWTKVAAKRVELIKEVIPALTNVAVLVQSGAPATHITLTAMERVADTLGLELIPVELKARDDIVASIAAVAAQRARALVLMEGPLWISNVRQIADLALESRLPMISFKTETKAGALLEYGANVADLFYRSAMFIDKILKGTPPADRPIERAVKFDLVVNLNSAKTLGIEVPTSLLIRADEVIE
jgi:putative ABC transport system substrate-binding protein